MIRSKALSSLFAIAVTTFSVAHEHTSTANAWVSGTGDDSNACTRIAPCKTFAGALTKTLAGGEIDAIDAGDFGSVVINKAITINGGGGQIASVQSSGTAGISIQVGATDPVTLRNLDIIGGGVSGDGIQITPAGTVHIENVHVHGVQGSGINVSASAPTRVFVDGSSAVGSSGSGITATSSSGSAIVAISTSHFESNAGGGVSAMGGSKFSVVDSTSAGNAFGFIADGTAGSASVTLTRCDATGNTAAGFAATQNGVLRAAYSSSELNGVAISNGTNGNTVTYGNNSLVGAGVFTLTSTLH